jgi:hypothetical protein
MKKYRLTKITVKTREIISFSKDTTDEMQNAVCPVCQAPLPFSLPVTENSAGAANARKRPNEILPAKVSGDQEKK